MLRKILVSFLAFLLFANVLSVINPIQEASALELLSEITGPRTMKGKDLSVTFLTNGTLIFSNPNNTKYTIRNPTGHGLNPNVKVERNSTFIQITQSTGPHYVRSEWSIMPKGFKLTICWNLPKPTMLEVPTDAVHTVSKGVFFTKNFAFNWTDAIKEGFKPVLDVSEKSINVAVEAKGCLDPLVTTASIGTPLTGSGTQGHVQHAVVSVGNDWYATVTNSTKWSLRCSTGGASFRSSSSPFSFKQITLGTNNQASPNHPGISNLFYNTTHILVVVGEIASGNKQILILSTSANCGVSIAQNTTISSASGLRAALAVTQNSTGSIFVLLGDSQGRIQLWTSNKYATTWTNTSLIAFLNPGITTYVQPQILNYTAGKIMLINAQANPGDPDKLQSRIFYATGNQSFGTITNITSTYILGTIRDYDCVAGSKVFCAYAHNSGGSYLVNFDGSSWSSATGSKIADTGLDRVGVLGLTKQNGDDTLIVYRFKIRTPVGSPVTEYEPNIYWNKTTTNGTTFISKGDFGLFIDYGDQDNGVGFLSVPIRPNSTGYTGLLFRNGTGATVEAWFAIDNSFVPVSNPPIVGGGGGGNPVPDPIPEPPLVNVTPPPPPLINPPILPGSEWLQNLPAQVAFGTIVLILILFAVNVKDKLQGNKSISGMFAKAIQRPKFTYKPEKVKR